MRPKSLWALAAVAIVAGCGGGSDDGANGGGAATFAEVQQIVEQRCYACHSSKPTEPGYSVPASNVAFDREGVFESLKATVYERVVERKDMPLGNATGMTQAERDKIASWYEAGAKT